MIQSETFNNYRESKYYKKCNFINVDFKGKDLSSVTFDNCDFIKCNFKEVNLDNSFFMGGSIVDSTFYKASMLGTMIARYTRVENCSFDEANINTPYGFNGIESCRFKGTDLYMVRIKENTYHLINGVVYKNDRTLFRPDETNKAQFRTFRPDNDMDKAALDMLEQLKILGDK